MSVTLFQKKLVTVVLRNALQRLGSFGLLSTALGFPGLPWTALGCFGKLWAALGCSGPLWVALGYLRLVHVEC